MAWPDPTTINWSNGFTEFFAYINAVTLGWASRLVLFGIFVIVLAGYYYSRDDFAGAFAAAGISTFVVALTGWLLDPPFVDWITFAMSIGIAFVGAAIVLLDRHQGTA